MDNEKGTSTFEAIKKASANSGGAMINSWFGKTLEWLGDNFGAWFAKE